MDHDTKSTLVVIVVLIIILGGLALFLRNGDDVKPEVTDTYSYATTTGTQIKTTTQTKATTTTSMEDTLFTQATLTTNKGVIEITFATNTPLTVKNFGTLAKADFYNGVRFHRVIKDFMIQTGDPLSKDLANVSMWGTGGPGYKFQDELTGSEEYPLGTVAMANAGPNTNGSQFFIVTANPGYPLPPSYTVFGHVTKGIETALEIQGVQTGQSDRPIEDVIIESITVK